MAAKSLVCKDCGTLLRSIKEAQDHGDATGHCNFEETTVAVRCCDDFGHDIAMSRLPWAIDRCALSGNVAACCTGTMHHAAVPLDQNSNSRPSAEARSAPRSLDTLCFRACIPSVPFVHPMQLCLSHASPIWSHPLHVPLACSRRRSRRWFAQPAASRAARTLSATCTRA